MREMGISLSFGSGRSRFLRKTMVIGSFLLLLLVVFNTGCFENDKKMPGAIDNIDIDSGQADTQQIMVAVPDGDDITQPASGTVNLVITVWSDNSKVEGVTVSLKGNGTENVLPVKTTVDGNATFANLVVTLAPGKVAELITVTCEKRDFKSFTEQILLVRGTTERIFGVSLKVITKSGNDFDHTPHSFSAHKVDPSLGTQYLLLLKNTGNGTDSFVLNSNEPANWSVVFEGGNVIEDVPKGEWIYQVMTVRVNSDSADTYRDITITATSMGDENKSDIILTMNTVETLPSSEANLDEHPAKVDYNLVYYGGGKGENQNGWYHNQGQEFEASEVIEGFKDAIMGMREGQTKVVEVFPEKGYGPEDVKHIGGRPIIFEITMLDINTED